MTENQQPPGRIKDIRVYRDSFIGMGILACIPFLIFGAIAVYGTSIAICMLGVWALILIVGTRWFMPYPRRVIGLGLLAFVLWIGVVVLTR